MNTPFYELLVRSHLGFGAVCLAAFWLQMLTRKSGGLHRLIGRVYFLAMLLVIASALPITYLLASGNRWAIALFFGFLVWITIAAGVGAFLAARWRDRRMPLQRRFGVAAGWILLGISLGLLAMFQIGGALFVGLGAFGTWAAISDLRQPPDALVWRSWQVRHIEGVIGTGIAVHVAFFAFGLRSLIGDVFGDLHFLFAFAVPVALGTWASSRFTRRYRGRTDEGAAGLGAVGSAGSARG